MTKPEKIQVYQYQAATAGPHLLVLGAIHGDEFCGSLAIHQCAKLIDSGQLHLKAGTLTMIPACNPAALQENARFHEENLNRVFKKHVQPETYEARLANILTSYVDACDFMLDLHSQPTAGTPFVFQDYEDNATADFAKALGVEAIVKGWPEMYAGHGDLNAGDTVGYAHEKGKTAILIECGQHVDPRAAGVAYLAIINSLAHFGMIDAPDIHAPAHRIIRGREIVTVPPEGGSLTREWQHLQNITKGQELAVSNTGKAIIAPYDGVILLPKYKAQPNGEWFYLATEECPGPA
jgi:predicted deacylase